jgi:hypothetical protein
MNNTTYTPYKQLAPQYDIPAEPKVHHTWCCELSPNAPVISTKHFTWSRDGADAELALLENVVPAASDSYYPWGKIFIDSDEEGFTTTMPKSGRLVSFVLDGQVESSDGWCGDVIGWKFTCREYPKYKLHIWND